MTEAEVPPTKPFSSRLRLALLAAAVAATVALGLALRLWMLYHQPLTSDEAVVGLMARQIRHGQMFTFFWGQAYGGVEPYLVAAWTGLAGSGPVSLNAVPTVLSALSAVLVWRIARRILPGQGLLAATTGLRVWIWPEVVIYNSTRELGFRGVTMVAGLGVLLMALRSAGNPSWLNLVALGLVGGVGWWSSPEIIYFLTPALLILAASPFRQALLRNLAIVTGAAVLGAAPWLATNLRTGFLSLRASSSPDSIPSTYAARLSSFLHKTLPMVLGLRTLPTGTWLWGGAGQVLCVLALLALVLACIVGLTVAHKGERTLGVRSLAAGTVIFPVLYAAFPATSYWKDGRYAVFLAPFIVLAGAGALGAWRYGAWRPRRRSHAVRGDLRDRLLSVLALVSLFAAAVVSVASFTTARLSGHPSRYLVGWNGPSGDAERAARLMEVKGIRNAYAQYWVAYDLDFLSQDRLTVSPAHADRWVAEYRRVRRAANTAWIFFAPSRMSDAASTFASDAPGPFGYPESRFLSKLHRLGVGWKVAHVGVLDAVIPTRTVTPREVGIPPPYLR